MDKKFVRVVSDVHCDWEGWNPTYRVYVNNELFAERTWTWENAWLEEHLQISAEPGKYQIRYELVEPHLANLRVENTRVEYGPGSVKGGNILRIHDESQ